MPMLEDIVKEANEKGLLMNNLFQLADACHTWQASFRNADSQKPAYAYGYGETMEQAAWRALSMAKEELAIEARRTKNKAPPAGAGLFD